MEDDPTPHIAKVTRTRRPREVSVTKLKRIAIVDDSLPSLMTLDDLLTMIVMIVIVSEACIVDAVDFAQRRWRSDGPGLGERGLHVNGAL